MDAKAATGERRVLREFEVNRLEEEVWALAYEEIWPVARRALKTRREELPDEVPQRATISQTVARSA